MNANIIQRRGAVNIEYILLTMAALLAILLGLGALSGSINNKFLNIGQMFDKAANFIGSWNGGTGDDGTNNGSDGGANGGTTIQRPPVVAGRTINFTINDGGSVTVWTQPTGTAPYSLVEGDSTSLVSNSAVPNMTYTPAVGGRSVRIDDSVPSSTESTVVNGFWNADLHLTDLGDGTIRVYSNNKYGFSNFILFRDDKAVITGSLPDFTITDNGTHTYLIRDAKSISSQSVVGNLPVYSALYIAGSDGVAQYSSAYNVLGHVGSLDAQSSVTADAGGNTYTVLWGVGSRHNDARTQTAAYNYPNAATGLLPWNAFTPDIAVDSVRGIVYMLNSASGHEGVYRFRTNGAYLGMWAIADTPDQVALDSKGNLYIACHSNRVIVLDTNGTQVNAWGSTGTGNGQFKYPSGIEVDRATDTVYVLDNYAKRVQVFSNDGTYLRNWATTSQANSSPDRQTINIDLDGNLYVVGQSGGNEKFIKYNNTGTVSSVLPLNNVGHDIAFVRHF